MNRTRLMGIPWGGSLLLLVSAFVIPVAVANDTVEFRGFGSLYATYADSEQLGFRRDLSQNGKAQQWSLAPDSVFGVQADWQLNTKLKATVQFVAKERAHSSIEDAIEWAYLSYDVNNTWRFRVGRISTDISMIGDVANVGYAYDWVRPPIEFYGVVPSYHFDGVEVTHRSYVASGYLSAKFFYGASHGHFVYAGSGSKFDIDPYWGTAIHFEKNGLSFRATYLNATVAFVNHVGVNLLRDALALYSELPAVAETLAAMNYDTITQYYTSGISYRWDHWTVLAEAMFIDSKEELLPSSFAAYTGLVRHFDELSVYGLLGHTRPTQATYQVSPDIPPPLGRYTQLLFDSTDSRQSLMALGVRWDFAENMALKFQWDHYWVSADQGLLWDMDVETAMFMPAEQVNVFSLGVSFIF